MTQDGKGKASCLPSAQCKVLRLLVFPSILSLSSPARTRALTFCASSIEALNSRRSFAQRMFLLFTAVTRAVQPSWKLFITTEAIARSIRGCSWKLHPTNGIPLSGNPKGNRIKTIEAKIKVRTRKYNEQHPSRQVCISRGERSSGRWDGRTTPPP